MLYYRLGYSLVTTTPLSECNDMVGVRGSGGFQKCRTGNRQKSGRFVRCGWRTGATCRLEPSFDVGSAFGQSWRFWCNCMASNYVTYMLDVCGGVMMYVLNALRGCTFARRGYTSAPATARLSRRGPCRKMKTVYQHIHGSGKRRCNSNGFVERQE